MIAFGAVISIGILAGMITFGFPMQQYFWIVALLLALPLYIGSQIDTRTSESEDSRQLAEKGYREVDPSELDTELVNTLARLTPKGAKRHQITRCFHGTHKGIEVTLLQIVHETGDTTERYAACAVWSPHVFPDIAI